MDKDTLNTLDIMEQIEFVNKKLREGYSQSKLEREKIISSRKTISTRFGNVGYTFTKNTDHIPFIGII